MEYTRLRDTGLEVSRICLGCMSYGDPDATVEGSELRWEWALDEERARPFYRRAIELGINFFDTANVYSYGASEEITGRALADFARRDEIVLATKVRFRMRPGPNGGGLSRKAILRAIDDSLRRLGTDYVDLYQIHRWDPDTPIEETMEALHDVVRAGKARYLGASSMYAWQLAKADLKLAEAQLAKTVLRAPFKGRLGLRMVSPGSYIPPGTEVVTLDDIDPLKVEFSVPEARAAQLQLERQVEVRADAFPDTTFTGSVYAITPSVDTEGRSIRLRALVDNQDAQLRPGMFVRVRLTLGNNPDAMFIPEEALIPSAKAIMVYKVVDGTVEATPVETGARRKGEVEILSGLEAGDTVITAGHLKVRPGMPVTVMPGEASTKPRKQAE